jgi:hypothetical protein
MYDACRPKRLSPVWVAFLPMRVESKLSLQQCPRVNHATAKADLVKIVCGQLRLWWMEHLCGNDARSTGEQP